MSIISDNRHSNRHTIGLGHFWKKWREPFNFQRHSNRHGLGHFWDGSRAARAGKCQRKWRERSTAGVTAKIRPKLLPPNPSILLFTHTWGESIILDFASCQHYTQANICPNAPSPCRRQDCCYNDCQAVVLHLSEL